jgi:hypothetical protein
MHPRLLPLPDILLHNLGRCSRMDHLALLQAPNCPADQAIRQHRGGEAYRVSLTRYGLDLTLQCVNADGPQDQWQWGLHNITLHTAASQPGNPWSEAWPEGLDADQATATDVVKLFEPDPTETLNTPAMVCFAVPGADGLTWALLANFEPESKKLHTLSLVRSGDLLAASYLPPWRNAATTIMATRGL